MTAQRSWFKPLCALTLFALILIVFLIFCFDLLEPSPSFEESSLTPAATSETGEDQAALSTGEEADFIENAEEARRAQERPVKEILPPEERDEEEAYCISGKVKMKNGKKLPPDLEICCLPRRPPFTLQSLTRGRGSNQPSYTSRKNFINITAHPTGRVSEDGSFQLREVPKKGGFLYLHHPYLRPARDSLIKPSTLRAVEEGKAREILVLLVEGGVVEGTVRTPDGEPVAGADVGLGGQFSPFFMFSAEKGIITGFGTETSPVGRFRFEQVAANQRLVLAASHAGFSEARMDSLSVGPGATLEVDISLQPAAVISGVVLDEQGDPAPDVGLMLFRSMLALSDPSNSEGGKARTDEEGHFSFHDLSAGSYMVRIQESGYLKTVVKGIKLLSGGKVDDLKLVLSRGLGITGKVVDRDHKPVAKARIKGTKVFSILALGDTITEQAFPQTCKSDEEGRFELYGLESDEYDLEITADGFAKRIHNEMAAGTEGLTIVMVPGSILSGIVISGTTGEAVKDYTIHLNQSEGGESSLMDPMNMRGRSIHTISHEKGKFHLDDLTGGTYEMNFKAKGFSNKELKNLVIEEGESMRGMIVVMPDESSISGVVRDLHTDEPIEGVSVSQKSGMEGLMESIMGGDMVTTDAHGAFRMGGLSMGPVRLVVNHARYEELKLEEINLMEGESVEGMAILMSRGAMVKGHVWTQDRLPLSGENIFVANTMGTTIKTGITDEDGYYEVSGLSKGNYSVTMMPKSFDLEGDNFMSSMFSDMKTQVIKLQKDEVKVIDIIMGEDDKEGTQVSGTVRQLGEPVSSAILQMHKTGIVDVGSAPNMVTTGKDGKYSLTQVEPGNYTLVVTLSDQVTMGAYSVNAFDLEVPDTSQYKYDVELPGGALSGTVVDRYTLEPLETVRVMLLSLEEREEGGILAELMQNRAAEMYSDGKGKFHITGVAKGDYVIRAGGVNPMGMSSGGYARILMENIHFMENEHKEDLVLKLEKGGQLEGKVTDSTGAPMDSAAIYLKGPGEKAFEPYSDCTTDGSGFFRYQGISPGKCALLIKHSDHGEKVVSEIWIEKEKTSTVKVSF